MFYHLKINENDRALIESNTLSESDRQRLVLVSRNCPDLKLVFINEKIQREMKRLNFWAMLADLIFLSIMIMTLFDYFDQKPINMLAFVLACPLLILARAVSDKRLHLEHQYANEAMFEVSDEHEVQRAKKIAVIDRKLGLLNIVGAWRLMKDRNVQLTWFDWLYVGTSFFVTGAFISMLLAAACTLGYLMGAH